ncbi:MAG: hypothetical protein KAV87_31825 [Desulfobacteraceae bacterium]|nr:hypothetical protein [Desulfobacteraceae bacterium]
MAKVNMNYKFKTFEGETIPRDTGKTRKVMKGGKETKEVLTEDTVLKRVCIDALLNPEIEISPDGNPRPVEVEGPKKFERYGLASRIYDANGIMELQSEEITLLKDLIGKGYGPIIVHPAWDALEGKIGLEAKKIIPAGKKN